MALYEVSIYIYGEETSICKNIGIARMQSQAVIRVIIPYKRVSGNIFMVLVSVSSIELMARKAAMKSTREIHTSSWQREREKWQGR